MKLARLLWTLGLLVAACQTETGPLTPDEDNGVPSGERAEGGGKADGARLRECLGTFRPSPPAGWRHFSSRLVSGLGCGVTVYPGENEMAALVKGALRVLQGKEEARPYRPGA